MKQHRNTKQRQLVLDAVHSRCDHPSADQIYMDVLATENRVSRGTVYRNLNILVESGDILQVKAPGADRYDRRLNRHYHLICLECGSISDFDLPYDATLDEEVAKQSGYRIKEHHCIFEGVCPKCQNDE